MTTKEQVIAQTLKEKTNEAVRLKREKMKNKVIFVGVGQCGCNLAAEMYDRGYKAIFVNTSDLDLHGLRVDDKYVVKIEDSDGCSGNRNKAKELFATNGAKIMSDIDGKIKELGNAEYVYFSYSEGGGSGSGLGPILSKEFGKKYDPDRPEEIREITDEYSNKYIGVVTAVPSSDRVSTEQHRLNAIECWREIVSISAYVRNIFMIDNNNIKSYKDGNEVFGEYMQAFLTSTSPDFEKIIDIDEISTMMQTKGYAYITKAYKTDGKENGGYRILDGENNIFVNAGADTGVMGISIGEEEDADIDNIIKRFGDAPIAFSGHNETEDTYIFAFGQDLPGERWLKLQEEVKKQREEREKSLQNKVVVDYSKIELDTKSIYEEKKISNEVEVPLDDLLAGFTANVKSGRRRR